MSQRECGKALRIFILYNILSTLITISVCRNIQEQDDLHPPAVNGVTNLMDQLKEKLNSFISSTSEDFKSNRESESDSGTQPNSIDVYESSKNIPDNENFQYRHHATPHPTLQNDGLGYDYDDNDDVNNIAEKVDDDPKNKDGKTDDETGIDWNTEKSKGTNNDKEEFEKEAFIPDCDIPPYPDMLRKTQTNFPEEDDENMDSLDNGGLDVNTGTGNAEYTEDNDDTANKQKLEDELIEELLDGSSGDMTSENMKKTEIGGNVNDLGEAVSIKAEDDFLKKLQELKNSLGSILSDEAPLQSPNLRNIMREVSDVLESRFGEIENMHKAIRVKDLFGRENVKKIQDYHKKTTGSPDRPTSDNFLLEVKKARKRLKLITKDNEEDLLPDYIEVMRELTSMLKSTKNLVRGIEDKANNDGELLGSNNPNSSAMSSTNENSGDQIKIKKLIKSGDYQLGNRGKEMGKIGKIGKMEKYRRQGSGSELKKLKRPKKWMNIDTLIDSDSVEDVPNEKENLKDKLRKQLKKQMKSRNDDEWGLEGSESTSLEDLEIGTTSKEKKKRRKRSFGRKLIEDL